MINPTGMPAKRTVKIFFALIMAVLTAAPAGAVDLGLGALGAREVKDKLDLYGNRKDITPPSSPNGLSATPLSSTLIRLEWGASTDDVGVVGYRVYEDGDLVAAVGNVTTHLVTGLSATSHYMFTVRAFDAAGNASGASLSVAATTLAPHTMTLGVDKPIPNAYNPGWDFCTDINGAGCDFTGVRDVRYGNGTRWAVKERFKSLPGWQCKAQDFGLTQQAGDHCEVANVMKTGTLDPPEHMHHDMPMIDLNSIPIGTRGADSLLITPTNDSGTPGNDVGAFRISCQFSHMSFNDPIVYPGVTGEAHLHMFFGNTGTNADSTAASLASEGSSTCAGGIGNRSAYWIPAMIDTTNGRPIPARDSLWYYKTGYGGVRPIDVHPMPDGLRIIAGNGGATAIDPDAPYRWNCETPDGVHQAFSPTIPACPADGKVWLEVFFPQCWDGVNLDSPNHKSHMAYPDNGCPATHPVGLPILSLNISFPVETDDQSLNWRLSSDKNANPAGITAHADFFEGWMPSVKNAYTTNCLNASKDCHAYLLGNGTMLVDPE